MLQVAIWRESYTSFSFPTGFLDKYVALTIRKITANYGSISLHGLDSNETYIRSKYGGVWKDWEKIVSVSAENKLIKTNTATVTVTIPANSVQSVSQSLAAPSGYTNISQTMRCGSGNVLITPSTVSGSFSIRNLTNSEVTVNVYTYMVHMRVGAM
ncbi:hypothetical protein LJC58_09705 [Lachnospiraceae bacterium OttesenSCG-928-D06]|nr:hypothetical protein [Lachnospiraceae bacterium OttesenSCG-928-D06]